MPNAKGDALHMKTMDAGSEPTVECPKCGTTIGITKALSHQAQEQVKQELQSAWEKQQKQRDAQFAEELERAKEKATAEAKESAVTELAELQAAVAAKDAQVADMRKTELGLRQKTRELDERAKQIELDVARRVDQERAGVEATVTQRLVEEHRLGDLTKDKQLADLRKQLEVANRRAQQGSQQTQGEALEADLEDLLRREFVRDGIEAIGVGERGGDIAHQVRDAVGTPVGTILWEVKNTKAFGPTWPAKLREDQRERGATFGVIVTKSLPDGIKHFGQKDGVWIACPAAAIPLAHALRQALLEVARARVAGENQNEKQAALYAYHTGVAFKQCIEAALEPLLLVLDQQEKERRALEAGWAKKERAIKQAITSIAALYGGVSGIIGGTMPRIERLELPPPNENKAA